MRIKECKEWDKLPDEVREILLENQKLINQHLLELEDDKSAESMGHLVDHQEDGFESQSSDNPLETAESQFSKAKKGAGVREHANIE